MFVKNFWNEGHRLSCVHDVLEGVFFFSTIICNRTSHYFVIANSNTQSITEVLFPLNWKHSARLNLGQECFSTQWTSKTLCKLAIFSHLYFCVPGSGAVSGFLWHCHLLRIPLLSLDSVGLRTAHQSD